jgi:hypothetical protein
VLRGLTHLCRVFLLFLCSCGIPKITGNGLPHRLAGIQQPKHDKEGHHRGHEIGVGDLPCTAMMTAVRGFLFYDDDGPGAFDCSSSVKVGRTCPGDCPAGGFDCHDGRGAFQKRDDQYSQHIQVGAFFGGGFGHVCGNRSNKAVAKKDAQKSSDQRCGYLVTDLVWGPSERAPMVMTTPRTAATIPRPGRESAMAESESTG